MSNKLQINIVDLIFALDDHDVEHSHFLDLQTGEIIFMPDASMYSDGDLDELREQMDEDPDRFCRIQPIHSSEGFQLMEDFIDTLKDDKIQNDLARAINRSKPFRNFKDTLADYPDVRQQWFTYHHSRMEQFAREWLEDEKIEVELVKPQFFFDNQLPP